MRTYDYPVNRISIPDPLLQGGSVTDRAVQWAHRSGAFTLRLAIFPTGQLGWDLLEEDGKTVILRRQLPDLRGGKAGIIPRLTSQGNKLLFRYCWPSGQSQTFERFQIALQKAADTTSVLTILVPYFSQAVRTAVDAPASQQASIRDILSQSQLPIPPSATHLTVQAAPPSTQRGSNIATNTSKSKSKRKKDAPSEPNTRKKARTPPTSQTRTHGHILPSSLLAGSDPSKNQTGATHSAHRTRTSLEEDPTSTQSTRSAPESLNSGVPPVPLSRAPSTAAPSEYLFGQRLPPKPLRAPVPQHDDHPSSSSKPTTASSTEMPNRSTEPSSSKTARPIEINLLGDDPVAELHQPSLVPQQVEVDLMSHEDLNPLVDLTSTYLADEAQPDAGSRDQTRGTNGDFFAEDAESLQAAGLGPILQTNEAEQSQAEYERQRAESVGSMDRELSFEEEMAMEVDSDFEFAWPNVRDEQSQPVSDATSGYDHFALHHVDRRSYGHQSALPAHAYAPPMAPAPWLTPHGSQKPFHVSYGTDLPGATHPARPHAIYGLAHRAHGMSHAGPAGQSSVQPSASGHTRIASPRPNLANVYLNRQLQLVLKQALNWGGMDLVHSVLNDAIQDVVEEEALTQPPTPSVHTYAPPAAHSHMRSREEQLVDTDDPYEFFPASFPTASDSFDTADGTHGRETSSLESQAYLRGRMDGMGEEENQDEQDPFVNEAGRQEGSLLSETQSIKSEIRSMSSDQIEPFERRRPVLRDS